jgi:hypothetical protein
MLEVLSTIIGKSIEKIIGSSIDIVAKKISWKRSLASKLINLFSCLAEIEKVSQAFYDDLILLASGKEPLTEIAKVPMGRIVIKKRAEELKRAVTKFSEQFREIEVYISIYDEDISFNFNGILISKGKYIEALDFLIDFFLISCPSLKESEDLSTAYLVFPSILPNTNIVEKISSMFKNFKKEFGMSNIKSDEEKLSLYNEKTKLMILSKFSMKEAHIHSASDLQYILEHVKKDIDKIKISRIQLAEFIKTNLPLEKILS